ncbi:unnamed protein product [Cylicocyclus nassatus]|uniref:Uncharacterized protein n=1 Tax=Cylicocyclus nassatus TaxID=53992 RepID=A0AA36H7S0_CYLNA|nr:unnamed protein product [Cylicocyclus nassatus]
MLCTMAFWEYHLLLIMVIIGLISFLYSSYQLLNWLFNHYTCECVDAPPNTAQNPQRSYVVKPNREVVVVNEEARPLPYEN